MFVNMLRNMVHWVLFRNVGVLPLRCFSLRLDPVLNLLV
jgi:hypothetical protein